MTQDSNMDPYFYNLALQSYQNINTSDEGEESRKEAVRIIKRQDRSIWEEIGHIVGIENIDYRFLFFIRDASSWHVVTRILLNMTHDQIRKYLEEYIPARSRTQVKQDFSVLRERDDFSCAEADADAAVHWMEHQYQPSDDQVPSSDVQEFLRSIQNVTSTDRIISLQAFFHVYNTLSRSVNWDGMLPENMSYDDYSPEFWFMFMERTSWKTTEFLIKILPEDYIYQYFNQLINKTRYRVRRDINIIQERVEFKNIPSEWLEAQIR